MTSTETSIRVSAYPISRAHVRQYGANADFVYCGEGFELYGVGVALQTSAANAASDLARLMPAAEQDSIPAHRQPLVVGTLGYQSASAERLWIPEHLFGADDHGTWHLHIGTEEQPLTEHEVPPFPLPVGKECLPDAAGFQAQVLAACERIQAGELEKVVLARRERWNFDGALPRASVLQRLRDDQPGCVTFGVGGLVGASPELLVRVSNGQFESAPLAGTSTVEDAAHLMQSAKNLEEHRYVIDAMLEVLAQHSVNMESAPAPAIEVLADVAHLMTRLHGTTEETSLDLACALHPTPAVAGTPTPVALHLQRSLEGFDRGAYAGPVGWMAPNGDGEWMLALRSAYLDGAAATLFTGAGIVRESDPESEWEETERKLFPMRRALGINVSD